MDPLDFLCWSFPKTDITFAAKKMQPLQDPLLVRMREQNSMTHTVLKVGGSLIQVASHLIACLCAAQVDALVVPGGGPFAETVRRFADRVDDATAHWMAVLAMNQYGFYLGTSGATLVEDLRALEPGICILLPFKILYEHDPLPHSWEVTSDSIACWVAYELHADLVIATDVDGIFSARGMTSRIAANELTSQTCVDAFLPQLLEKYSLNCTVVNGRHFERVIAAIQRRSTIGTTIIGRK